MVLHVPFPEFRRAVDRWVGAPVAYLEQVGPVVRATAANPLHRVLVCTDLSGGTEQAEARLREEGFEVHLGSWTEEGMGRLESTDDGTVPRPFIAAVAFQSDEDRPGVWVDAYPYPPTEAQVLNAMHDEMTTNGEISEVAFETFVRLSKPTVAVLSPEEIANYARRRQPEGQD
ncbi:MAG: hypothetical protein AMXMBFR81_04850 [Chthonomonas sp.]